MELQCFQITMHKGWALLEMARPDKLNVIDETVLTELEAILQHFKEEQVKAVVVTGQGRAFAAGADVGAMAEMDSQEAKQFSVLGNKVFQAIEDHPAVFVAAVNGYALGGGCELALAMIYLASEKATFAQPEINLGIPGFGGTQRLPHCRQPRRRNGSSRAGGFRPRKLCRQVWFPKCWPRKSCCQLPLPWQRNWPGSQALSLRWPNGRLLLPAPE